MVFQYGLEPVLISLSLFTKLMIYVSLSPQILAFVRKYGLTLNHFFTPGGLKNWRKRNNDKRHFKDAVGNKTFVQ